MASPHNNQLSPSPPSPVIPVEVEVDDERDADSTLGDDESTTTTSISSSVLRYEWKHGRRYHSYQSGAYNFPNDEQEQSRLDMIHHVFFRLLEDRLFLAPVSPENGLRVLDIGTGTGIWPIHFGDEYPGAQIVGNDLSPIQPGWAPPNVRFIVDDVELDWPQSERYDYIHCRYMAASIKDWPRLVGQIYAALKPGGWVEFQESANTLYSEDESLTADNPMVKMMDGLIAACEKIGRTMDPAPCLKGWAEDAGFHSVTEQRFKLPIGSWPKNARLKEVGTLMGVNFFEGVEAFTAALFTDVLGWSRDEVTILNAEVRAASRRRDTHPIFDFLIVTGQKPSQGYDGA